MTTMDSRLQCALAAIDTANQADPNLEPFGDEHLPKEYAYSLHMTRWLYYQWRQACGRMHGRRAAEIMAECGYPQEECERVETILTKRELRQDADTQLLEDVACMVFLEKYFADFYEEKADYDREKWLRIVRRTWGKMSPRGHEAALKLAEGMPAHLLELLQEALAEPES